MTRVFATFFLPECETVVDDAAAYLFKL
jgi:hypothetical protein